MFLKSLRYKIDKESAAATLSALWEGKRTAFDASVTRSFTKLHGKPRDSVIIAICDSYSDVSSKIQYCK